jgi:two-component system, sensor histidine kinase RegB
MTSIDANQIAVRGGVPEWLKLGLSRLRLQTIVRLRWIAVVGQTVTVLATYFMLGFDLPIVGCLLIVALSAWLNVALRIRYPASYRLGTASAAAMLAYDILQLAALLYLTGGLQNPFAFLLIAPVTVSASTLPPRATMALGGLAIAAATLLTAYHFPLPWFPETSFTLPFPYIMGIWTAVVSGILFIGLYSWRIADEGRRMAEALAATEMVLAREQRLSALDGLAAAAAHGLGTPLATIAVVTKELLRDSKPSDPHHEDLTLLRTQAERCREILSTLAARGQEQDLIVSRLKVSELVEEVVAPHRPLGVPILISTGPEPGIAAKSAAGREPVIHRNPGLIYGLGNLVENAVDFASTKVEVEARWSDTEVRIVVADDGAGFPVHVLEQLGEPFVTTRPGQDQAAEAPDDIGMGLGFFIAKTLLERSGARLMLANRRPPQGGAVITLVWPRARFEAAPDGADK